MRYWLMRKNERITILDFSDDGVLLKFSSEITDPKLAPLEYRANKNDWLKKWWQERSIPLEQGAVAKMLSESDLLGPQDYLFNNLGLSLNDYYWICPLGSKLKWEDVNLYDNDFKDDLLVRRKEGSSGIAKPTSGYSPNSSLQGQLEKTWQIRNGRRVLIKGNSDDLSCESLNEVFASLLHKKQGYDNYVEYKLIKIKGKSYSYGCISECFTNQDKELVTAWALLTSEKKKNDKSDYEFLISLAGRYGVDETQFRKDLEYQIMTDYILSNRDRHMNNIGILRDAKTLQLIRMAPIFDTGRSMFVRRYGLRYEDLINYDTNSFYKKEKRLLSLVTDKTLVDATKLPDANDLAKLYSKDAHITQERIDAICRYYEIKIDAFKKWQDAGDLQKSAKEEWE